LGGALRWKSRAPIHILVERILIGYLRFTGSIRPADCRNAIGWNAGAASVLPYAVLVGREVYAIDFILSHITVKPLDLRPHPLQCRQRA